MEKSFLKSGAKPFTPPLNFININSRCLRPIRPPLTPPTQEGKQIPC